MQRAIVIIPTYNEKENIQKVIPLLLDVFKKIKNWDMGILVVDDTSPDKTYEIVKKLTKKYKNIHLLINPKKEGLGGAYLKGMEMAYGKLKAEIVFEFDADLSHDHTKIPDFMTAIDEGADFVIGSRYINGGGIPSDWGMHRKFFSIVGNIVISTVLTNFKIKDWTSGFRAIRKKVYTKVHPLINDEKFMGYTFQIGFLNNAVREGFLIKEVPFVFVDRTIGESKLGTEYIKNTLIYIFKVRFNDLKQSTIVKFLIVGGFGTLVQLSSFIIMKNLVPSDSNLRLQLVNFISIEFAILSNFIINNAWTFKDKKLKIGQMPLKFIQFNIASFGSILIQAIVMFLGLTFIGRQDLFTLPIIGMVVDTPLIFVLVGIVIGLFWNFFAYNKFIWKKKK